MIFFFPDLYVERQDSKASNKQKKGKPTYINTLNSIISKNVNISNTTQRNPQIMVTEHEYTTISNLDSDNVFQH